MKYMIRLAQFVTFGLWRPGNPFRDGEKSQICVELLLRMLIPEIKEFYPTYLPKFAVEDCTVEQLRQWLRTLPNLLP